MVQELLVEAAEAAPMGKPERKGNDGGSVPMDVDVDLDGVAAVLLAVGAGAQVSTTASARGQGASTESNYNSDTCSYSACASSVGILSSDDEGGNISAAVNSTLEDTPLLVAGEPASAAEELMPAAAVAEERLSDALAERRSSLLGSLADLATQELMSIGDAAAALQGRLQTAAPAAAGGGASVVVLAQEEAVGAEAGQAVPLRRQRPRSISCPEGMELQGWSYRAQIGVGFHADSPSSERGAVYAAGVNKSGGGDVFGAILEEDEDDARALRSLRDVDMKPAVSPLGHGGDRFVEGAVFGGGDSGGNVGSDMSMLPHLLPRFSGLYNKHGRIGIYTRQEREAIIARFKSKRSRRVWRKKIRYSCRKNLADKRLRVKGRFVRMSAEQRAALEIELRAAAAADAAAEAADGGSGGGGSSSAREPMTRQRSRGASLGSEADRGGYGGDRDDDEEEGGEGEEGGNGDDGEDGEGKVGDEASEEELPPRGVRVRRHSIAF